MPNRREFIQTMAGASAGTLLAGRGLAQSAPVTRREVRVGGKRVKVVDVHAHAGIARSCGRGQGYTTAGAFRTRGRQAFGTRSHSGAG